jgi:hypothetical protein
VSASNVWNFCALLIQKFNGILHRPVLHADVETPIMHESVDYMLEVGSYKLEICLCGVGNP